MKILKILILLLCLSLPLTVGAAGNAQTEEGEVSQEEVQEEWLAQFDFSEVDSMLKEIFPKEKLNFRDTLVKLITGDIDFSFTLVKQLITDQFSYEVRNSRTGMIHILLLVIIGAIFANFSSVFQSTQVSEISFSMLYMLLLTICLNNFRLLVNSAEVNLEQMTGFMEVLGPVYFLAVAFATGSSTSVTFYQFILLLIYLIEVFIQSFLVPLTQIYLIVRILGELSPEVPLTKFGEFIETIVSWSLKTLLAGVVGLNVIQGLIHPAIDAVKRSLVTKGSQMIPIIGDAIGGTAEIVLGTAVLIKNGIGVAGMVICLIICIVPIVQMAVTTLLYQLIAALMQPISDKRMVNCISTMAEGTKMLLRIVFTTGMLFLLTIAVAAAMTGG